MNLRGNPWAAIVKEQAWDNLSPCLLQLSFATAGMRAHQDGRFAYCLNIHLTLSTQSEAESRASCSCFLHREGTSFVYTRQRDFVASLSWFSVRAWVLVWKLAFISWVPKAIPFSCLTGCFPLIFHFPRVISKTAKWKVKAPERGCSSSALGVLWMCRHSWVHAHTTEESADSSGSAYSHTILHTY